MWLFWYDDDANKLSGTRLTNKVKYILYSALYYICCGNRQHQVWINTKWVTFQHSIFPQNDLRPLFDFRSHCLFSLLKRMFWSKRNGDNYEWGGRLWWAYICLEYIRWKVKWYRHTSYCYVATIAEINHRRNKAAPLSFVNTLHARFSVDVLQ